MEPQVQGWRRIFTGCLVILVILTACLSVTALGLDGMCVSSVGSRLPIYPGATLEMERHSFLRATGMGETVMILYTPDDPQTVTAWYARTVGQVLRENALKRVPQIGAADWNVTRAEDGVGSQIILYSYCMG